MNHGRRHAADGWVGASLSWWGTGVNEQGLSKVRTLDEGRGHEVVETGVQVNEANIPMQQGFENNNKLTRHTSRLCTVSTTNKMAQGKGHEFRTT